MNLNPLSERKLCVESIRELLGAYRWFFRSFLRFDLSGDFRLKAPSASAVAAIYWTLHPALCWRIAIAK